MRSVFVIAAVVVLAVAGCVQLAATSLYGDLARPPAFPAIVPPAVGIALGRPFANAHVPAALRAAYARGLLHRGADADAAPIIAGLPAGPTRDELAGTLALHRHDDRAAVDAFIAAGDAEQAQTLIDAIAARGDIAGAVRLERALAASARVHGNLEILATSLWRLGALVQTQAYTARNPAAARRFATEAMAAYDAALALAPNDETFLLSAGTQALTLGDRAAARAYFQRALDAVPDSADARRGLARAER